MEEEQKLKILEEISDPEALHRYLRRKRNLKICIIVLAVIAAAGMIVGAIVQAPAPGEITVTLEVRYSPTANPFAYFVHIPAGGSLKDALLESGMITGADGADGFVVRQVGDILADPDKGEYWTITSYEEAVDTPPESLQIEKDTHFELIFNSAA